MVEIQFPLAPRFSTYLSRELGIVVGRGVFRDFGVSVKILPYLFNQDLPQEDISRVYRVAVNPNEEDMTIGEYQININRNALTRSYLGFFPENTFGYQQSPSGLLIPWTNTPRVFITGNVRKEFKERVLELYQAEFITLAQSQLPHLPQENLEYFWQVDILDKSVFREYFEREREWWEENVGPFELVRDTGYREYHTQYLGKPVEELSGMQLFLPSGHDDVEHDSSYHQFLATCFEDLFKKADINGTVLITRRADIPFP